MATRATLALDRMQIRYDLRSYEEIEKTALEVSAKLDLAPGQVFKTLVVQAGSRHVLALVPAERELSEKRLAQAAGVPSAKMADPRDIERLTGYVRGSVSPLATRRPLAVFIDMSARDIHIMAVSAGARGQEILLRPEDLRRATDGVFAPITAGPR